MESILHIKTISELNQLLRQDVSVHPLISVVDFSKVNIEGGKSFKVSNEFYSIILKNNWPGALRYGRNYYDFQDGTLVFMAPNQVMTIEQLDDTKDLYGWGLYFHPDLIRKTTLGSQMKNYSFFSYSLHEALHLSENEKSKLTEIVNSIKEEMVLNMDRHTHKLIVSMLELLLDYCSRYYDRQFMTRTAEHKDLVSKFETLLTDYFASDQLQNLGFPSISYFADLLHLSTNYLTDLLKKETEKNGTEHIHSYAIELAKNKLLSSDDTISVIAYDLGFEYPQYFAKMFKKKTGMTPTQYRRVN